MNALAPIDVLAIGAHPDDAELCAGGALAWARREGMSTAILDLTRGERATQGTPEERACEASAAAEILGLAWRANLELPDRGVVDELPAAERLALALRRARPRLVMAHSEHEEHPDHRGAALLFTRARRLAGRACAGPSHERPHEVRSVLAFALEPCARASLTLPLDAELWARKRKAVAAHASQLTRPEGSPHLAGRGDVLDRADRCAMRWGALSGSAHAEAFHCDGPIPSTGLPLDRAELSLA